MSPVLTINPIIATDRVYDGTTAIAIAPVTLAGIIDGDIVSSGVTSAQAVSKNVGNNIAATTNAPNISINLGSTTLITSGYQLPAATPISLTVNITPANLTLTATTQTKIYDGGLTVSTSSGFTSTGLVGSENVSAVTLAYTDKNAGVGNKTISISNAVQGANTSLSNYNISYVYNTTSTINKATISFVSNIIAQDKSYDGTSVATLNTGLANFNGLLAGDHLTVANATGVFSSTSVGGNITVSIYGITLGGSSAGNYQLANTTAITTANVTPALGVYNTSQLISLPQYVAVVNQVASNTIFNDIVPLSEPSGQTWSKTKGTDKFVHDYLRGDQFDPNKKKVFIIGEGLKTR